MPAPRAQRNYRVTRGWVAEVTPPIVGTVSVDATGRRVNKPNHAQRRDMRLKAQRAGKHAGQKRGAARPQNTAPAVSAGPSEKTIGRILKEYA